jgi:hypothetical protein
VLAEFTPMINAGMVFCDRHYGGINYPKVLLCDEQPLLSFACC